MTARPPTAPRPITAKRLEKIRRADPEMIELLESYVSTRLIHINKERVQLLKLRRFLEPAEQDGNR